MPNHRIISTKLTVTQTCPWHMYTTAYSEHNHHYKLKRWHNATKKHGETGSRLRQCKWNKSSTCVCESLTCLDLLSQCSGTHGRPACVWNETGVITVITEFIHTISIFTYL